MRRSPAEEELVRQSRRLRAQFLREVPTLSATQMEGLAVPTCASSAPEVAEGWLRDRRVFALKVKGELLFPAFQFDALGQPWPVMGEILARLPADLTPWQIAFSFVSGNGWLGGAYLCERLEDREEVVTAAQRLTDSAGGCMAHQRPLPICLRMS
jgi:hypothetical protein